ncbi:SIR2 family protein [Pseudolactococcus yaeyamensis]
MNFDTVLLKALASNNAAIFMGAGTSKLVLWNEFVESIVNKIPEVPKNIESNIETMEYAKKSNQSEYFNLVNEQFNPERSPEVSEIQKLIFSIGLTLYITTNFDKSFENYVTNTGLSRFAARTYDDIDTIIQDVRTESPLLIKMHGCINDRKNIIFTKSDYLKLTRKHRSFLDFMGSIFLQRVTLFIGYSFRDPDLELIFNSRQMTNLSGAYNYILMPENEIDPVTKELWLENFGLKVVEFEVSDKDITSGLINCLEKIIEKIKYYEPNRVGQYE